jgi:histidinol-phosphate aminotransferase
MLEMHRNARIDFYDPQIEQELKAHLSLQSLNRYPDVEKLYTRLSQFHQLEREKFLITSGIDGGIKSVFEMCTKPGSRILVPTPTYGMYDAYSQAYETQMVTLQSHPQTLALELDGLLNQIDDTIEILFLPNPHVPIEHVFESDALEQIIQKAQQHDVLVFIDEAYYMFGAPTVMGLVGQYENLIVARTFSKGLGLPAIRLGYLIANPGLIRYLESKRFAHEVNSLTIDIAIWAMDNITRLESYAQMVCQSREWLITSLHERGYATHGGRSNTILIEMPDAAKAHATTDALREQEIIIRGYLPDPFDRFVLVTVGSREKTERFLDAFLALDTQG